MQLHGVGASTYGFVEDTNIQSIIFYPWFPKIHVLLLYTIHSFHPNTLKSHNLVWYQLYSLKSKVSSMYHHNQIWVSLQVQFILRQNSSPTINQCNKLYASTIQWWNRPRIHILIPKERNRKEGRMTGRS